MDDLACKLEGPDQAVLVVKLPRALDHYSAESLTAAIHAHLPNRDDAATVLDMSEVEMISSIGIAALLQARELCLDQGSGFRLASVPDQQLEFFKLLRLDRTFEVSPSVEEAIMQLSQTG